jgi:hypothetical protein
MGPATLEIEHECYDTHCGAERRARVAISAWLEADCALAGTGYSGSTVFRAIGADE